ncbi:MAG TPA: ribosome biogenesis GTPase Der [Planctomycetaceae bacterium]|nr:ribosome biogenesis GTPase Der [Planctomycetaceae bacterium]
MSVSKVAIIGRPNVGKSSLFNWLSGRLISVVDPTAGVTRDRVEYLLHENDRYFELVDTGGLGIEDVDNLTEQIEYQILIAIEQADLLLFVVDAQSGVVPLDLEVAERLRRIDKPKLLVVNKCDSTRTDAEVHEFRRLCEAPLVVTSVKANRNRDELIAAIVENLPPHSELEEAHGNELSADPELKLAIVGRRNVGKSTFINALAESERVIVSEIPGTTRDSVDIRFDVDGKRLLAIDTPGVRKRKSLATDVEFYGLVRAQRSIRRADVVFMFFDAKETISRVDIQLVDEIAKQNKPCVFVVNKWDSVPEMTTEAWSDYLLQTFATMRYVPVAFLTAKEGRNVRKLVNLAQSLFKQARLRVSTGRLNRVVRAAIVANQPPMRKNRRPKIYYATQVGTEPPTIVLKCNDPAVLDESWKRYLLGVLHEELPYPEIPIKLYFRQRERADETAPSLEELAEAGDAEP